MLLVPDLVLPPQKPQRQVLLGQVLELEIKSQVVLGQVGGSGLEHAELGPNDVDVLKFEVADAADGRQDVEERVSVFVKGRSFERVVAAEMRVDEDGRKDLVDVEMLPDEKVRLLSPEVLVVPRDNLVAFPDVVS